MAVISDSHKFIFIHIWKNAGTTITELLKPYVSPKYAHIDYHSTAPALKKILAKEVFDEYFKFAFVRNPWDWQVSLYEYIRSNGNGEGHPQYNLLKGKSFEEYIDWRCQPVEDMRRDWPAETIFQHEFIFDENEYKLVDFVGRYDRLESDLKVIFSSCLGLHLDNELPCLNSTKRKPYWEYYSETTMQKIANYFAKDCELLGYQYSDVPN